MRVKRLVFAYPQEHARFAEYARILVGSQPQLRQSGAAPAQLSSLEIQLKADGSGKGGFVKVFTGPFVNPTHRAGKRQIPLVDFAQQYMQRGGVQGGCQAMSGHVDQEAAQQHAVVTPIQEIQVAADVAERLVNCLQLDVIRSRRQRKQSVLHPRRQRRFAQRLPFTPHSVRYVAERQQHRQPILVADQRCRDFDIHQPTALVFGGLALRRHEATGLYLIQQLLNIFGGLRG